MKGLTYPVKYKDHPFYLPLLIRAGGSMYYAIGDRTYVHIIYVHTCVGTCVYVCI